jgi:hypothetical protein
MTEMPESKSESLESLLARMPPVVERNFTVGVMQRVEHYRRCKQLVLMLAWGSAIAGFLLALPLSWLGVTARHFFAFLSASPWMQSPLASDLRSRFDLLLNVGSLEHLAWGLLGLLVSLFVVSLTLVSD